MSSDSKKKNLYPISTTMKVQLSGARIRFIGNGKIFNLQENTTCDMEILNNFQFHIWLRFYDKTKEKAKDKGEMILDVDIYIDPKYHKQILELLENNSSSILQEKDRAPEKLNIGVAYIISRFLVNKRAYRSIQRPANAICYFETYNDGRFGLYFKYEGFDFWFKKEDHVEFVLKSNRYRDLLLALKSANSGLKEGQEMPDFAPDLESSDQVLYKDKQTDLFDY